MKQPTFFLIALLCGFLGLAQNPVAEFLGSLNQQELNKTVLASDDTSRETWHFFPASMLDKKGISLAELNSGQTALFHEMLKAHLSKSGYSKAIKIIDLEDVLLELGGNANMRDSKKYYIAFYGNPNKDHIWGWSFEGHHLSLNFTSIGNHISFAPRFMGASPANVTQGKRKGQRVLAQEEDLGLELVNALDANQREKAIFRQTAFKEIITFVESTVKQLDPVGINMEKLNSKQQQLLWGLINVYIANMPEQQAQKRLENLKKEQSNQIYFGWAGSTTKGEPHYYRIQGKTFLIEFDNVQNNSNHIHSVWRDFNGDFGRDLIREHYQNSSHH